MAEQEPRVLGDRYEIHQRLARGGMAQVYLARDRSLDRPVAVKELVPEFATDPSFVGPPTITYNWVEDSIMGTGGVREGRGPTADDEIAIDGTSERATALQEQGATVMYVAVDGRLAGLVAVADPIKGTTADAVEALRQAGLRIVMLTGDNRTTADAVRKSFIGAAGRTTVLAVLQAMTTISGRNRASRTDSKAGTRSINWASVLSPYGKKA